MSILDDLKDMVKGGAKAASVLEETVQAAAPEPVAEPAVASAPVQTVAVSPMETVVTLSAAVEVAADGLDEFGEEIERPVSEAEEADETLHVHSRQRIAYLLRTYEKNRPELTQKRIAVDHARFANKNPQDFSQKPQPPTVRGNPQLHIVG